MSVGQDARFDEAWFHQDAGFENFQVGGTTILDAARFDGTVSFDEARLNGTVYSRNTPRPVVFGGDALFTDAKFGGVAIFQGTEFRQQADFSRASSTGGFEFGGVRFALDSRFMYLAATRVVFSNSDRGQITVFGGQANFTRMQVQGDAFFNATEFVGPAIFAYVSFDGEVHFNPDESGRGVVFRDQARFDEVRIGGSARFQGATFHGIANFATCYVRQNGLFLGD